MCFLLYRWARLLTTCPVSRLTAITLVRIKRLDLSISTSCCPASAETPTKLTVSSKSSAVGQPRRDLRCARVKTLLFVSLCVNVNLKWQSREWFNVIDFNHIAKYTLFIVCLEDVDISFIIYLTFLYTCINIDFTALCP